MAWTATREAIDLNHASSTPADASTLFFIEPSTRTVWAARLNLGQKIEVTSSEPLFGFGAEYVISPGLTSFSLGPGGEFFMMPEWRKTRR